MHRKEEGEKKGINDRRLTALRDEVNLTRAVNEVRPGREERGGLFFLSPFLFLTDLLFFSIIILFFLSFFFSFPVLDACVHIFVPLDTRDPSPSGIFTFIYTFARGERQNITVHIVI